MIPTRERLAHDLDQAAAEAGVPSLVVADRAGLLIAGAGDQADVVAAVGSLRADGHPGRAELIDGRVKAREVDLGDERVVLAAVGDTVVTAAAFDKVIATVKAELGQA